MDELLSKLPRFDEDQYSVLFDSDTSDLKCPGCGELYLHHGAVRVFDRREDSEVVDVTKVVGGLSSTHRVPSTGSGNPSSRRGGITIEFSCEHCEGPGFTLTIAQHKGYTLVGWQKTDPWGPT